MAAIGCGISHKDTDKCSNNETKKNKETKQRNHRQILFQNTVKVTQKSLTKYPHDMN
jgi:hypothetical protein